MKNIFFCLLLAVPFFAAYGQAYHPLIKPDFTWEVMFGDGSQICLVNGGERYHFDGDTLIAGNTYKIIRAQPVVQVNPGPYCPPFAVDSSITTLHGIFLREDTAMRQVYVYNSSLAADELFYDFTLVAGDTLHSTYAGVGDKLVVDSVTMVMLLDGSMRKQFHLNNGEHYIEGIGGSQGVQFPIQQAIGFWNDPICYRESGIQLWGDGCLPFLGVEESSLADGFVKVFPNPVRDEVTVTLKVAVTAEFSLYDATGRRLEARSMDGITNVLDVSHLPGGSYLYQVQTSQGIASGKLVLLGN